MALQSRRTEGSSFNRRKVIILMTIGVFIVLGTLMTLFFKGWPPWPVLMWFTISHGFFCWIITRARPFHGPYREPLADDKLPTWTE